MSGTRDDWQPILPVPSGVKPAIPNDRLGKPSATWNYVDGSGRLLYRTVRFDFNTESKPDKEVLPLCYCQNPQGARAWRWQAPPEPRPLFGLDALAARPDAPVIVCEGEKAAGAAARLFPDHVAVTSQGGAKAAAKSDWTPFRGRRVIVWPDKDSPGMDYARDVARKCIAAGACEVRVVAVPDEFAAVKKGWDLADGPPSGWDTVRLRGLLDAANPLTVEPPNDERQNHPTTDDDAEIARLAELPLIAYERERHQGGERLGCRVSMLDKLVEAKRPAITAPARPGQGRSLTLPEPESWPEPVDGAEVLTALARAVRQYVVLDAAAADAAALWIVGTFAFDDFMIFPRLAITSPEKGCGKTTLLDVLSRLVCHPLSCANITAAAVFRAVEFARPTLLIDEADTFLPDNEELRGVLNSGHRRDGRVVRLVGDDHEPRTFSTWAPAAVAAIGKLPDTLADRSIPIPLRRRRPDEPITSLRLDRTGDLDCLASKAVRFAHDCSEALAQADPEMPAEIFNRVADNWRPLFAIADTAGGDWPQRARKAAMALVRNSDGDGDSTRVVLLSDIRQRFDDEPAGILFSEEIVNSLVSLEDRPWTEYSRSAKPITANQLARLLKPFRVSPGTVRRGAKTGKGYKRVDFDDAFARYLRLETVTASQMVQNRGFLDDSTPSQPNGCDGSKNAEKPHEIGVCDGVTVRETVKHRLW